MKYTSFYLTVVLLFCSFLADAQIMNRIRRAAEQGVANAVEKRVEREVENATQRQLEKAFSDLYGPEAEASGGIDMSNIFKGINTNVATEETYHFTGKAEMEMTGTDEKGKTMEPVRMTSFLNESNDYSAMEINAADQKQQADRMEKTIMIFDLKNNASIILMENEGEKTRMAFGFDATGLEEQVDTHTDNVKTEDFENIKFEKTGNTKTIAGYSCEEYRAENDEWVASYWISKDPIPVFASFWGKNSPYLTKRSKNANKEYFKNLPEGDILAIESQSKKDKTKWSMTTKKIDSSSSTSFVMADYPNMMAGQTAKK
ncbi:MAG TPA: DUF4412 domain-containing protein [Cyclobacteriaceae bacterium]|nr:DUF4412 domain-containing protein [Cyclobacteriaceae bacterium]